METGDAGAAPLGSVLLRLEQPVEAHGETLRTLTLRPLRPEDVTRVGYPLKFDGHGGVEIVADRMSAMMARLADVPPSTVAQLAMADWQVALGVIIGFFGKAGPSETS
jgi:hypothetical protein